MRRVFGPLQETFLLSSSPESALQWEPFNAVLSFRQLVGNADKCFLLDTPTYDDSNHLVSAATSGVTSCLRLPGQPNYELQGIAGNLICS